MRGGEMAALKEVPFGLYYGTVDATPLFVVLLGLYVERTSDEAALRALWPAAERRFTGWRRRGIGTATGFSNMRGQRRWAAERPAQSRLEGFVDAMFHADGELAQGPIALCEVQGYAYAARAPGLPMRAPAGSTPTGPMNSIARPICLPQRFEEAFWCEEIGLYAIALDGREAPMQGALLQRRPGLCGQALRRPDRARSVADAMVSSEFFSGWGVRTIAQGEARYNPMSYHNGSIWPHDNSLIALGLSRYGFMEHVDKLFEATFAAASYMDLRRLPELYCGFRRRRGAGPTLYPVACSPQAWASGALFLMIQAALGIEFVPEAGQICFRNPRLPASFNRVILRQLGMDGASVDIELRRSGAHTSMRVLRNSGSAQVSMIVG